MGTKMEKNFNEVVFEDYPEYTKYLEWITSNSINIIYAPAGVGKTYLSLALAIAIASRGKFLKWSCLNRGKVLFIDGEMGMKSLGERMRMIFNGGETDILPEDLSCISYDSLTRFPNLGNPEDFEFFEKAMKDKDVIIIDNLDTCTRPMDNRDSDLQMWFRLRPFLFKMRNDGKCIIIVHHANATGGMYGTTKIGNSADNIISLSPVPFHDKNSPSSIRIHLKFEKGRHLKPEQKSPLYVEMINDDTKTFFNCLSWYGYLKEAITELEKFHKEKDIKERLKLSNFEYTMVKNFVDEQELHQQIGILGGEQYLDLDNNDEDIL